ncbi:MAG: Flp pilus assembly complex ATPase component TadA [Magnetococcus sp. YQC-5]
MTGSNQKSLMHPSESYAECADLTNITKNNLFLCTCGQTKNPPICDGFHKRIPGHQGPVDLQTHLLLHQLLLQLHYTKNLFLVQEKIEQAILELVPSAGCIIYKRGMDGEFHATLPGQVNKRERKFVYFPGCNSLVGYVALTREKLILQDCENQQEIFKYHSRLVNDPALEKHLGVTFRSLLLWPIFSDTVHVGVLQLHNRQNHVFSAADLWKIEMVTTFIGQKFRYELAGTSSPFEQLVLSGKLSKKRLDDLLQQAKNAGMTPSRVLMEEGGISSWELGRSLERFYQTTWVEYDPHRKIPKDLMQGLNRKWILKNCFVPIAGSREKVEILIDDPTDIERILEIERHIEARSYIFRVGIHEDIIRYLSQEVTHEVVNLESIQSLGEIINRESDISLYLPGKNNNSLEGESLVVKLVNQIFVLVQKNRGSDLHVIPQTPPQPIALKLRVDGVCQHLTTLPFALLHPIISRIKIMADLDITERRLPQDGKIHLRSTKNLVGIRVAILPTVHGESAVLRFAGEARNFQLEHLDFAPDLLIKLKKLVASPYGLILVVGPTGSGKTTTLHALLKTINTPDKVIWTVEDPIEIIQDGLRQVQVNTKAGLDFAMVLRSLLRADPDVIMIGEMRDSETARIAVKASLTGHLVLSTLHANSAVECVSRLLDMGLDPIVFADSFLGVISQRLVRTLCNQCKIPRKPNLEEELFLQDLRFQSLLQQAGLLPGKSLVVYSAPGCEYCNGIGYKGRTALHELLINSKTLRHLIRQQVGSMDIQQAIEKEGFYSMAHDGVFKLLAGQIDYQEFVRVIL